jgi:hypothetical protein
MDISIGDIDWASKRIEKGSIQVLLAFPLQNAAIRHNDIENKLR